MDKYIQTIADEVLNISKRVIQLQQIIYVLIKTRAINMAALNEKQAEMVNRFISEWETEWKNRFTTECANEWRKARGGDKK